MSATTPNFSFRYPDLDDQRVTPDRMGDLALDIDAHLQQRLRGPNPSIAMPLHQKISRAAGILGPTLLAETVPWELALLAGNAKATPGGTTATNQRLSLAAVYLEKNSQITAVYKYCTAAYGSAIAMRISIWTYDGTTFTCVYVSPDCNTGTGYRGFNTVSYTVPTSGIYYIGYYFNGTASGGADLMFIEGSMTIASGDFTGGKNNIGLVNNWPRLAVFSTTTATFLGQTVAFSSTSPAGNLPWISVVGTLAA